MGHQPSRVFPVIPTIPIGFVGIHHRLWHAPRSWLGHGGPHPSGAWCIHEHEASWTNDGITWDGRPSPYFGGLSFLVSTWNTVAGGDVPYASSGAVIARQKPRIQLHAAFRVWKRDGGSWREWSSRIPCHLS